MFKDFKTAEEAGCPSLWTEPQYAGTGCQGSKTRKPHHGEVEKVSTLQMHSDAQQWQTIALCFIPLWKGSTGNSLSPKTGAQYQSILPVEWSDIVPTVKSHPWVSREWFKPGFGSTTHYCLEATKSMFGQNWGNLDRAKVRLTTNIAEEDDSKNTTKIHIEEEKKL